MVPNSNPGVPATIAPISRHRQIRMDELGNCAASGTLDGLSGVSQNVIIEMAEAQADALPAIGRFMFHRNVPNTARAHRAAFKRLWTPALEAEMGPPPDPAYLVKVRGRMARATRRDRMCVR